MKLETIAAVRAQPPHVQAIHRVWAIGQLLDVTVIGIAPRNSMTLRIGPVTVDATGITPFPVGTRFTARVTELQPRPVLTPVTDSTVSSRPRVETEALRALLPRQLDAAPAWRALEELVTRLASGHEPPRAPGTVHAAHAVLAGLPNLGALDSAEKIQQAVAHSGLRLEAALAEQVVAGDSRAPSPDRKWQLLELLQRLPPALSVDTAPSRSLSSPATNPPVEHGASPARPVGALPAAPPPAAVDPLMSSLADELRERVEGLLANLTTRQLQTAAAAEQGQVFGLIELPVRLPDGTAVVQLEYSREDHSLGADQSSPHTLLVVVPVGEHELRVRLSLAGDNLSVVAWADDPELRGVLEARQGALESRLANCGFTIGHFVVAPVAASNQAAHLPQGLIDTLI